MRIRKCLTGFIAVIMTVAILCVNNVKVLSGSTEDLNVYDEIDDYLAETFPATHFPSLSVTIVDSDGVLLSKTYGDEGSADTPYVLGSVSKSFTALCIMQLVEQGRVSLDSHLSDYLPQATDGDKITILQLLNHTSGLGEHQNLIDFKITGEQGVHLYANVNYSLLGEVIEVVSGMSYEDYVTKNIIEPLGMKNTFAIPSRAEGLIQGHENWFGLSVPSSPKYRASEDTWITSAAGYISSSTEDLGRYLQMYINGGEEIISEESINEMFYNSVPVKDDIPYEYGMGWNLIHDPLPEPVLRHSGLVETGMTCIYILPESDIGVAMTVNTNDYFVGTDFADRLGWSVILLLTGGEVDHIGRSEYVTKHLMYDAIYLAVIVIAILPLILLGGFRKSLASGVPVRTKWTVLIFLHLALPVFLLLLPQIFFATPLWVVKAFVPDMYVVIIFSVGMLFVVGIIKTILLLKRARR